MDHVGHPFRLAWLLGRDTVRLKIVSYCEAVLVAERRWSVRMYSAGMELRYDRCLGQWRLQEIWKDLAMQSELATVIAQRGCCRCRRTWRSRWGGR